MIITGPGKSVRNIVILISLFILTILIYFVTGGSWFREQYLRKYERSLIGREEKCNSLIRLAVDEIADSTFSLPLDPGGTLFRNFEKESVSFLVYRAGDLVYWNDNSFDAFPQLKNGELSTPLVFINNGWFLNERYDTAGLSLIALSRVYSDYSLTNDFFTDGFVGLRGSTGEEKLITDTKSEAGFPVIGRSGDILFRILIPEGQLTSLALLLRFIPALLLIITILWLTGRMVMKLLLEKKILAGVALNIGVHLITYALFLIPELPGLMQMGERLFSPLEFTLGPVIPSCGHLLILSLLLLILIFNFFRVWSDHKGDPYRGTKESFVTGILPATAFIGIVLISGLVRHLLLNSNISLETYNILKIDWFSVVALFSILSMVLAVELIMIIAVIRLINSDFSKWFLIPIPFILSVVGAFLFYGIYITVSVVLFALLFITNYLVKRYNFRFFNGTVIISAVLAIFFLVLILRYSNDKEKENLKVLAVSYATDHDPLAEYLLIESWPGISSDSILLKILEKPYFTPLDVERITSHLDRNYFDGYWNNYDIGYVLCTDESKLRLAADDNLIDNCFTFFGDRITRKGESITGTGFWFIENEAGRAYYLGAVYHSTPEGERNAVFIELVSQVTTFQAGYPELLLDKRYSRFSGLKEYSSAKYVNDMLAVRTGEYPYSEILPNENIGDGEYYSFSERGNQHFCYQQGSISVIISRPEVRPIDKVTGFAYLFVFILLFASVMQVIGSGSFSWRLYQDNFRQRLQVSFLVIITGSFLAIGFGVSYLTIEQYRVRHNRNIKEKLASVSIELDHKLSKYQTIDRNWKEDGYTSLDELLVKFSNVFYNDINLYGPDGSLIATSRPELFSRELKGSLMNADAYYRLAVEGSSEYIHQEQTGKMSYQSGYMPVFNYQGNLLAYLNLPYFTLQSTLTAEVSGMVVTVVNFTLLLIIVTMALAVFISEKITYPLRLLREGLASIELGKKSEPLKYSGNDELSELVRQYNHLVDELEAECESAVGIREGGGLERDGKADSS